MSNKKKCGVMSRARPAKEETYLSKKLEMFPCIFASVSDQFLFMKEVVSYMTMRIPASTRATNEQRIDRIFKHGAIAAA